MTWDELQKLMKDTDADVWAPMDPSPINWTWKGHPPLYVSSSASEIAKRQATLLNQFNSMINSPWEMHSSRSVHTTKGGRRQSFKMMMFAGNGNGFGGYAIGRGKTYALAKVMAWKQLMNSMMFLPRRHGRGLFHSCEGRWNTVQAHFRIRKAGTGNVASKFGTIILQGFGLDDVSLNVFGGWNVYNHMHAIFDGLSKQVSNRTHAIEGGASLYRELDYNDIPVPAPDEAEWEAQTERVRDAVIDQVYINPITYPERMASPEEQASGFTTFPQLPGNPAFTKPGHMQTEAHGRRRQWAGQGGKSRLDRVHAWSANRDGWKLATLSSVDRDDQESVARNK